ncbi:MAG: hypothetical protein ACJ79K_17835 [Gemmatimonadaceae bacterium]
MPTPHSNRRRRFATLLAMGAALAGCGGGGADKEIETLQSWRATIDLAAEARTRGWVTPRYVRQLRDEAHTELGAAAQLEASDKTSSPARDSLASAARDLERALAALDRTGR